MSRVGESLAAALKSAGLTGADFAERVHMSPQFISDVKNGHRLPTPDRLMLWADELQADRWEWAWLLLHDLWGEETAIMMWRHAVGS